jgi:hypothetical protein
MNTRDRTNPIARLANAMLTSQGQTMCILRRQAARAATTRARKNRTGVKPVNSHPCSWLSHFSGLTASPRNNPSSGQNGPASHTMHASGKVSNPQDLTSQRHLPSPAPPYPLAQVWHCSSLAGGAPPATQEVSIPSEPLGTEST